MRTVPSVANERIVQESLHKVTSVTFSWSSVILVYSSQGQEGIAKQYCHKTTIQYCPEISPQYCQNRKHIAVTSEKIAQQNCKGIRLQSCQQDTLTNLFFTFYNGAVAFPSDEGEVVLMFVCSWDDASHVLTGHETPSSLGKKAHAATTHTTTAALTTTTMQRPTCNDSTAHT